MKDIRRINMTDEDVMFYIALGLAVFFTFTISLLLCWE